MRRKNAFEEEGAALGGFGWCVGNLRGHGCLCAASVNSGAVVRRSSARGSRRTFV